MPKMQLWLLIYLLKFVILKGRSSRTSIPHLYQTVLSSIILSKFVKDLKRKIRVSVYKFLKFKEFFKIFFSRLTSEYHIYTYIIYMLQTILYMVTICILKFAESS